MLAVYCFRMLERSLAATTDLHVVKLGPIAIIIDHRELRRNLSHKTLNKVDPVVGLAMMVDRRRRKDFMMLDYLSL